MYLLGIDNGSTIAKAGIYDERGNEIAVSGCKADIVCPKPGYYERDLEQLWQSNTEAVKKVLEKSGLSGSDISAVSLTGHGNGLILCDKEGRPCYPAIEGADSRARDIVDGWVNDGTFKRILPRTMQSLWPAQPGPLLVWMKQNHPQVLEKSHWLFMVKDYIRFRLTGRAAAEITDMSATSIFNVRDKKYDEELLSELDLADCRRLLPELVGSTELCGEISEEAAVLTGLEAGTPVAGGAFDIDAAALATGMIDESRINVIAGTWCNNQFVSRKPVVSKDLFMTSLFADGEQWLVLEGSATSASNLEWFVSEFMEEEQKQAESKGTSVYQICDDLVSSVSADESDIIFVPFLYGSNASVNAKSVFLGMQGHHSRAHVVRALFEGIVFSHKSHIEKLMKFREQPDAARIAGGAANSRVWTQMFADILGLPVEVTSGRELGAMGAALCAGVGIGAFRDIAGGVESMVHIKNRVEPDTALKGSYDKKYGLYKKAIRVLEGYWE